MDTWFPVALPHPDPWVPACLGSPTPTPMLLGASEDSQLGLPLCLRGSWPTWPAFLISGLRGLMKGSLSPRVLAPLIPFLEFLFGASGLQRWASWRQNAHQRWLPLLLGLAGPRPHVGTPNRLRPAALPPKQQVAPSCLRSCSPLCSSCFSAPRVVHLHPWVKACLSLRDPLALDGRALGFAGCFLLICPLHPQPGVEEGQVESAHSFPLLSRALVCTPLVCGARLCLSS